MDVRYASNREKAHFESVLVDMHARSPYNISLFWRDLEIKKRGGCHVSDRQ